VLDHPAGATDRREVWRTKPSAKDPNPALVAPDHPVGAAD